MTTTTINRMQSSLRVAGDGWWIAAAIVLLGATIAVVLALTLGPLEHPVDPSGGPAVGSVQVGTTAHDPIPLPDGRVCVQCGSAV